MVKKGKRQSRDDECGIVQYLVLFRVCVLRVGRMGRGCLETSHSKTPSVPRDRRLMMTETNNSLCNAPPSLLHKTDRDALLPFPLPGTGGVGVATTLSGPGAYPLPHLALATLAA